MEFYEVASKIHSHILSALTVEIILTKLLVLLNSMAMVDKLQANLNYNCCVEHLAEW